jgi:integrase
MAVTDRWHRARPAPGEPLCEHGKVPAADHGRGRRWLARWRDPDGAQRSASFDRKSDAERVERARTVDVHRGDYVDPRAGKVTLQTYGDQWRKALTCDPATLTQITSRLTVHVYPKIGDRPMGELARRPSLIQQWIKGLEADLSPSTIKGVVGWVSTIFRAAVDDGIVSRNPCEVASVRRPKVPAKKAVPWQLPELEAMAAALPGRYRAMTYLGAGCGHRQGELFGVAVDDVDFLGRVVHVRRQVRLIAGERVFSLPKGGKQRTVPLPESVGLELAAHIAEHGTTKVTLPWKVPAGEATAVELLFTTPAAAPLERNDFNRAWRSARRAAGIADTRDNGMHALRHTAASAWLAAGVDVRTVAEYLGHSDPGFTLRTYTHLMPDAADRARRAMDAFFQNRAECAPDVHREAAR